MKSIAIRDYNDQGLIVSNTSIIPVSTNDNEVLSGTAPAPVVNFTADVTRGDITLSVNFTDTSTNTPTSWDWDFGDGTPHSTDQNPSHNYTVEGIYTVALTATNAGGFNTETKTNFIMATPVGNAYIDCDNSGSGGVGTELNPYTKDQFCIAVNGSDKTFNARGTGTITSVSDIVGVGATILRWDASNPWRLKATVSSSWKIDNITLKDGVLFHDCPIPTSPPPVNYFFLSGTIENCDLRTGDNLNLGNDRVTTVKGCNLITSKYTGWGQFNATTVTDCIIILGANLAASPPCTINNCVQNLSSWSSATANNCQIGWTPPSWPAWDAVEASWDYDTLSAGINTPPQPGNSPYTNYATGLFGNDRTGIGAGAFPGIIAPVITDQPVSAVKTVGEAVTFTVTATGTPTPTYQWRKDTVNIGGATSDSYTIASVVEADAADYDCVATNAAGSDTSAAATLTVNVPVTITTQPQTQNVDPGATVTFTVAASGTAPITYQWKKDGSDIAGLSR